ncbi:MAG: hypothetical protein FGM14_07130 [Flavobacteriales bacterium]|nr:hypothetical protein [Flavobacteriales bacterium]
MIKIFKISFLFLLIQNCAFGQFMSGTLGPKYKGFKRIYQTEIIGKDESGFFVSQMTAAPFAFRGKLVRESYNFGLEKTNSAPTEIKSNKNRVKKILKSTIIVNNKLYAFYSKIDNVSKINTLTVDEVDKSSLFNNEDEKVLAEVSFEETNKRNTGVIDFVLSPDSSKILVYYLLPFIKGEPEKFGMHVYSNEFEEIWNKEIELPIKDELFNASEYTIGNDGTVYLLGKVYEDVNKEKKRGEVNYKFHIFIYNQNDEEPFDLTIDTKKNFLNQTFLSINKKNELVCLGLYTSTLNGVNEGTFYTRIDSKTHQVLASSQKEFSELMDDNNNFSEKKRKRKQDRIYRNYVPKHFIQKEDGGVIFIAEQYYVVVVTTTSTSSTGGTTTKTTYYYHYDNILILKIDKNGKFVWQKIIPKKQVSANDGGYYLSFALGIKDENLYFLYNTPRKESKIFNYRSDVLSAFILNKDGELSEKNEIIKYKNADVIMVPKTGLQLTDNEIYMFGRWRKTSRMARINI